MPNTNTRDLPSCGSNTYNNNTISLYDKTKLWLLFTGRFL